MKVYQHETRPQLVKADEAAKMLAISERKLWEITKRNEIQCIKIGRAVRYDVNDVAAFINKQRRS